MVKKLCFLKFYKKVYGSIKVTAFYGISRVYTTFTRLCSITLCLATLTESTPSHSYCIKIQFIINFFHIPTYKKKTVSFFRFCKPKSCQPNFIYTDWECFPIISNFCMYNFLIPAISLARVITRAIFFLEIILHCVNQTSEYARNIMRNLM